MPIYEYRCESCGERCEAIQRLADPPLTTCENCGGPLKKLVSAPAFQFKGSGWYVTDYADKPKAAEGSKEGKGDTGPSDGGSKDSDSKTTTGSSKEASTSGEGTSSGKSPKSPQASS